MKLILEYDPWGDTRASANAVVEAFKILGIPVHLVEFRPSTGLRVEKNRAVTFEPVSAAPQAADKG